MPTAPLDPARLVLDPQGRHVLASEHRGQTWMLLSRRQARGLRDALTVLLDADAEEVEVVLRTRLDSEEGSEHELSLGDGYTSGLLVRVREAERSDEVAR